MSVGSCAFFLSKRRCPLYEVGAIYICMSLFVKKSELPISWHTCICFSVCQKSELPIYGARVC
jgi:hypothetical protein